MISRYLESLVRERLFQKKAIVVLGPRQVGKTTLMRKLFDPALPTHKWFNGEDPDTRELFSGATSTKLKAIIGDAEVVVLDEAQRIESIGLIVKMLVDNYPDTQVMVTGSSALELADGVNEPLTGRKWELCLYPLSYKELEAHFGIMQARRLLHHRMIYGFYPDVVTKEGREQELLIDLCNSYLYKDILAYQQVKKPAVLEKLVQALALQLGNEVSYHELGQLVGLDPVTAERYVDLLEKAFVIFRLPSLNRNIRNEIKKGRKIYFHDTGIRNAIIRNFNPLGMRQDTGALWENFCIVERMKAQHHRMFFVNRFFWRTQAQQEIDYVEEFGGKLHAFEFKWNPKAKAKFPQSFLNAYADSEMSVVTPENFDSFLI